MGPFPPPRFSTLIHTLCTHRVYPSHPGRSPNPSSSHTSHTRSYTGTGLAQRIYRSKCRAAANIRTQPDDKTAPARKARGSGKQKGRIGCIETRDYLDAHPVRAEDITLLQGYRGLIWVGRRSPITADALMQIGMPYPMVVLGDGEGEQKGMTKGAESTSERSQHDPKILDCFHFFCPCISWTLLWCLDLLPSRL